MHRVIVPDEKAELAQQMKDFADEGIALVVTTGGTGFSVRDVTPEATLSVCERLAPGIPEAMRGSRRHPQADAHRESAGQCQSGGGMPGLRATFFAPRH